MKKSTDELVSEIKQIHAQYLMEVGSGGHKVWPRSIKERVFELSEKLSSVKQAGELCGISVHTIYQWRSDLKKEKFKSLVVKDPVLPEAKSVTVTNTKFQVHPQVQTVTVTVTTPSGFIVSGLDVEQVITMFQKLGVK